MPSQEHLSVGILGAGDITRKAYLPLLSSWPDIHIAGLFNRTRQTADEVVKRWHLPTPVESVDSLIDLGVDAAFVLTSTESHEELIRRLLEADIDVFVEKPATTHSQSTQALAELADERQRVFMVGFNRRFAPLHRRAKEIFGNREIQMCLIEKHRSGTKERDLAATYLDDTIHQIDLLRFYCGEITPTATYGHSQDGRFMSAASLAQTRTGGQAVVLTSRQAGIWQERVYLHGGDFTVELHAFRQLRVRRSDDEQVIGEDRAGRWFPQLVERGFAGEIEHFFACVRERKTPETSGSDSAKTQRLLEDFVALAQE
jgi:virulence factor